MQDAAAVQPVVGVDQLKPYAFQGQFISDPFQASFFDGGKFATGFGPTQMLLVDYFTLRARSSQLFTENMYARGIIRRLVTNEINVGLTPETMLDENILGMSEEAISEWSASTEMRFMLWGRDPHVCDWKHKDTFGQLQRVGRLEALVGGDVLVVLRHSRRTRLQKVQLISGAKIMTPIFENAKKLQKGHRIVHGVELDRDERVVAYWVKQQNGKFKRLPAFGERSGRRIAWLVFGTDKRVDDVRGQPLLALMLQSLKEVDRYRDSAQRQALVNSMVAMFIEKGEDKMGSLPMTGGAVRRDTGTIADEDGGARDFNILKYMPGTVIDELQTGEKLVPYTHGTDLDFEAFERVIMQGIAWANEIPPEILTLSFSSNYSASQAALNEFKIYLQLVWTHWGETFCQPIYTEWLLSETLLRNITAPGLVEAWRDSSRYEVLGAWVRAAWYGSVKMTTDPLKQVKASELLIREGWSTNSRESRTLTSTRFEENMKRIESENRMKVKAMRPILEMQREFEHEVMHKIIAESNLSLQAKSDQNPILQAISDLGDLITEASENPTA